MVNGERDHFRRIERYLWRMLDGGPVLLPGGGARRVRHVYSGAVVKRDRGPCSGRERAFGGAYNLAQDETPTLRELLERLAGALGARAAPRRTCAEERVRAAGLDPLVALAVLRELDVVPRPGPREGGARLRARAAAPSTSTRSSRAFLAHPPAEPPPGLRRRDDEIALAR